MRTNPNDTAFALQTFEGGDEVNPGLTKREYFAAMAMQAILPYALAEALPNIFKIVASDSVEAADALINALKSDK